LTLLQEDTCDPYDSKDLEAESNHPTTRYSTK